MENQRYVGERVDLDGNDYLRCTFKECELVYSGEGSVGLDDYGQQMVASLFAEIRRSPTV